MSDEGEKTCPLCAEEMDLTDQQLKPCRCGYEICVWCWHHIMDMAEKDETEGRCPACRLPYDKEKIVGMAAKCERLVAEINFERKIKSQKSKTKTSEGRKQQLSSVRVIQRNLVYIVGLPLNLGDEDLLQRREYFGQYGKVLKVSMSRTAAGVIQQFPNNTCSVYITYSKEEEAVRCIQSVHGFVLEGKSLKACFGTTKYCHAWLRNVPCSNPDCLYLHEIGSQEDSFTKDEIISAYTRSRVQQITGTTNNLQRRSGSVLPPPFDDYCITSSASAAKPIVKSASNNTASISKDSPPNGSSSRSAALPAAAAWGTRASNQQLVASPACSNGPSKQKPETGCGTLAFSSAVANTTPASTLQVDLVKKPALNEDSQISYSKGKSDLLKPLRQHVGMDCRASTAELPPIPIGEPATVSLSSQLSSPPLSKYSDKGLSMPPNVIETLESTGHPSVSGPEKEGNVAKDVLMQNLCSDMSVMSIDSNVIDEHSGINRSSSKLLDPGMIKSPGSQGSQVQADQSRESLTSPATGKPAILTNDVFVSREQFDWRKDLQTQAVSRVQQITGTTNNLQRRSGSVLPPPFDDYCITSSASAAKPIVKSASNNTASISKDSPPNGSSSRSAALPAAAAWGTRASNQQLVASPACSNGPSKQKPETGCGTLAFSSAVANTTPASTLQVDLVKKPALNEDSQISYSKGKSDLLKPLRQHVGMDCRASTAELPPIPIGEPATVSLSSQLSSPPLSKYSDKGLSMPPNVIETLESTGHSSVSGPEKEGNVANDVLMQNLCSDMSVMSIDSNVIDEHSGINRSSSKLPDPGMIKSPRSQGSQVQADQSRESLTSPATGKPAILTNDVFVSREQFDWRKDLQTQAVSDASPQEEEDVLSFDSQRLKDPEVVCRSTYLPNSANSFHVSNHSRSLSLQHSEAFSAVNLNSDPQFVDNKFSDGSHLHSSSISLISNGYPEKLVRSSNGFDRTVEHPFLLSHEGKGKPLGRIQGDSDINTAVDRRENNIISNILSMDFDAWEDRPLALHPNLAKFLGETDKEPSSVVSSSWKGHNNNQSRFSFARQEETKNQAFDVERSFSVFGQVPKTHSFTQDFAENREPLLDKLGIRNGFYPSNFEESDNFPCNPSVFSSNKLSAVSRSQISAPPGFSVPSRAPPPGFSSHERVDQPFDALSGNHLLDSSSLLRNTYQTQHAGNISSTGDIEFIDPAILAVGKGRLQGGLNNPGLDMRSNFPPQLNAFENEARLQLMMQRSLSPHQNLRYADVGDSLNSLSDSYAISSRLMDQSQVNNLSPYAQLSMQQSRNSLISNGHWDGWSEVQGGNSLGMAELLRNERLGFNKFYTGYEESKFRMPSSGDIYNRTFGM
ncbi:uncharacterized protein LOC116145611 [Pistacia vera]|uniref:uncharacterized protein LOC116145611 n=1 Tax=Pistacia vera TaxID=55513 RepID=UPI001263D90D|nr:uncharacterized protein LOC116145611 [Pistacia vera]